MDTLPYFKTLDRHIDRESTNKNLGFESRKLSNGIITDSNNLMESFCAWVQEGTERIISRRSSLSYLCFCDCLFREK